MKVLFEFLVLILFFATYYITKDILLATFVAIVGGIIQATYTWITQKKLDGMQLVSLLIVVFFGGATLLLKDAIYIQWKPTVLYWMFALILIGGLLFNKNFLQKLLGKELTLPSFVWNRLTLTWGFFFIFLGSLNLWVVYHYDENTWVTFKTFGSMGLLFIFIILQGIYIAKYLPKDSGQHKNVK